MKPSRLMLIALLVAGLPALSQAGTVTWTWNASITSTANFEPPGPPAFLTPGSRLRLAASFNSTAPVVGVSCLPLPGVSGCVDLFPDNSLQFEFDFGPSVDCDDETPEVDACRSGSGFGRLFVGNDTDVLSPGIPRDRLSLVLFLMDGGLVEQRIRLLLDGPPDYFPVGPTHGFFPADRPAFGGVLEICDYHSFTQDPCAPDAETILASVPAPGILGLLGLGLPGLVLMRRRKAS